MTINEELKPLVRATLLALGRRATEAEFRKEYWDIVGESFSVVLQKSRMSFMQIMGTLSDVCRVWRQGNEIMIERLSTEETKHMDHLTINKKKTARVCLG